LQDFWKNNQTDALKLGLLGLGGGAAAGALGSLALDPAERKRPLRSALLGGLLGGSLLGGYGLYNKYGVPGVAPPPGGGGDIPLGSSPRRIRHEQLAAFASRARQAAASLEGQAARAQTASPVVGGNPVANLLGPLQAIGAAIRAKEFGEAFQHADPGLQSLGPDEPLSQRLPWGGAGNMVGGQWQPNWLGRVLDFPHTLTEMGNIGLTPMLSHLGGLGLLDLLGSGARQLFSPRYLRAGLGSAGAAGYLGDKARVAAMTDLLNITGPRFFGRYYLPDIPSWFRPIRWRWGGIPGGVQMPSVREPPSVHYPLGRLVPGSRFPVTGGTIGELEALGRDVIATRAGRPGFFRTMFGGNFAGTPAPRWLVYGSLPFLVHNFYDRQRMADLLLQQAQEQRQNAGAATIRSLLLQH
jgi:hypothetical protein